MSLVFQPSVHVTPDSRIMPPPSTSPGSTGGGNGSSTHHHNLSTTTAMSFPPAIITEPVCQWILYSDIKGSRFVITLFVLFVCLFCCFTSQVNSYGHGGTVSLPNHTFSWASLSLEQAVNQYFMHILLLVTDNNPS